MIFSLDVRRARKGDCFLLHFGANDKPGLAIIDGGPSKVYKPHLKPRLKQIRKARGLSDDESLAVDLMMVSHIDEDHIYGILELTKELVDARGSGQPLPLKIKSLWHNSFDDIIGNKPDELLAAVTSSYGAAALTGSPDMEGLDADMAMVMASVGQGFHLRDDAKYLRIPVNREFDGKLVMAAEDMGSIELSPALKLTVVGPSKKELLKLQKDHDAFLKRHKDDDRKRAAALASLTDTSVANLSSLVVLCEVGDKRILLTGDARGDKIMEGLEQSGLVAAGGTFHVDILKMPHHGSDRNVDKAFFSRVAADHYVFSGNGEHGNPERATLQMLLDVRGDEDFMIHLTYPVEEIDADREKDWKKQQQKEVKKKKKKPETKVRDDWSAEIHGLAAFFADNEGFAEKVNIVSKDKPYLINLLDAVGF